MSGAWIVVRRQGALWGLPAAAVVAVERGGERLRVRLTRGGEIDAESVLALTDRLEIRRVPKPVRGRVPAGTRGLALHAGEPLLVLGDDAGVEAGRGGTGDG